MDNDIKDIKKGISDIKLSIIIAVLATFFVASVFVWGIFNSKLNDISLVVKDIDDKTMNLRLIAE